MASPSWFGVFDTKKPLEQGLIIKDFDYFEIGSQTTVTFKGEKDVDLATSDVIVLTQSCDLVSDKVKHIHVCPIYELEDYFKQYGHTTVKQKSGEFRSLKQNREVSKFLTNRFNLTTFPGMKPDYYVVALDQAVVVSSHYLHDFAKSKRKRPYIKPPYREAMAQAYGLYFMRVGNPINIDEPTFQNTEN